METLNFLYNLFIIMLFTVLVGVYTLHYLKYKQSVYLWISILFLAFIADNTILYMVDTIDSFSYAYHTQIMTIPLFKTAISIVTVIAMRMILGELFHKKITLLEKSVFTCYTLGLFLYPLLPFSKMYFFLYFTFSQIITIMLYIYFFPEVRQMQSNTHLKWLLYILVVINFATIAEDFIVIFNFDTFLDLGARIHQRNFFEDIGSIIISFYALFAMQDLFNTMSPDLPTTADAQVTAHGLPLLLHEQQTAIFVQKYQLTNREAEVLELLLLDMSNQEIADALFITVGTLKNHIHNIYQKCDVGRRFQLKCLYDEIELTSRQSNYTEKKD